LGTPRLKDFLRKLGMFEPVRTELHEAAKPMVPQDWKPINTMTISYGHGISVSPLHVVRAISALAGDGVLKPLTFLHGEKVRGKVARVASQQTVQHVRDLLRLVVAHGTAKGANAPGYQVGGKTGTAEKVSGSSYKADAKLASFVGVFPAQNPRYSVLVMVDEPKGTKETYGYATGGWVSAPVVGRFIQRAAPALGIAPQDVSADMATEAMWQNILLRAASRMPKAKEVQDASF